MIAHPEGTALVRAVRAAYFAALALLFLAAHSPWLRAGLTAEDYSVRLGEPHAGALGAWEARLPLPLPGAPALWMRLEALACLALFALGASRFLRRTLAPWVGKERARTVELLLPVFFLLHPLLAAGAAGEAARGGRLALALAGLASALFLAGRQEGRDGRTAASLALFLGAGFFSSDAAPFCLLFALAEYTSAHRHRPRGLRARTALTTALVFGAAAVLPRLLAAGEPAPTPTSLRARLVLLLENLGTLCLPGTEAAGILGVLGAGAVLLLVFQPLLRAARSAPRLWGGLCAGWSVVLCATLAWWSLPDGAAERGGRSLLALGVACAGFALAASALSPGRARWITLAAGLLFAPIAHASARPLLAAGARCGATWRFLTEHVPAGEERVYLLDPGPAGLDGGAARAVGWLLHPALAGTPREARLAFDPGRVRALSSEGLALLLRSELAPRECPPGTRVLHPDGSMRVLPAPSGATAAKLGPWRGAPGLVLADGLDPRALEGLEVVAELASLPEELTTLSWRAADGGAGEVAGVVRELRGRRVARFDLHASLAWLLAGEVRSLALPHGRRAIEEAEFLARLPRPEGQPAPIRAGPDWLFHLRAPEGGEGTLTLLALSGLELGRRPVTREADGRWRARDVDSFLEGPGRGDDEVLWELEFQAQGVCLARLAGAWPALP